jgi:AcrR family transcriptional regulator
MDNGRQDAARRAPGTPVAGAAGTHPGAGVGAGRRHAPGRQPAAVADRTREQILEAALGTFAARGFAATSLRDIAAGAGTTHGLIRHYFGVKEDVWRAAVDRAVHRFATAVTPYAVSAAVDTGAPPPGGREPHGGGPPDVVAHAARGLGDFLGVAARHPEVLRLLVHESEAGGPRLDYVLGRFRPVGERMAPLFARLQAAGALRAFPDNHAFFLTFLMAGAVPFALPALAAALGTDLRHEAGARAHAARVIAALLGPTHATTPPATSTAGGPQSEVTPAGG